MDDLTQAIGYEFDPGSVEIRKYEPIPPGNYKAEISAFEVKPTRDGTGTLAEVEFTLTDSKFNGASLKTWINLKNKSEKATSIGIETLAKLSNAVGILKPKKSEEFIGKKLVIKIDVDPGGDTYTNKFGEVKVRGPQNTIKDYFPHNTNSLPPQPANTGDDQIPDFQSSVSGNASPNSGEDDVPWA